MINKHKLHIIATYNSFRTSKMRICTEPHKTSKNSIKWHYLSSRYYKSEINAKAFSAETRPTCW